MKLRLITSSILALATLPNLAFSGTMGEAAFSWEGFYAGISGGYGNLHNKGNFNNTSCEPGSTISTPDVTNSTISITPSMTETTISIDPSLSTTTITTVIPGTTVTNTDIIPGSITIIPGNVIHDFSDFNSSDESWALGAEIGYDKQFGPILFGGTMDVMGTSFNTNYTNFDNSVASDADLDWFSTARLRIGVPFNQFLIYGTGGFAVGGFDSHSSTNVNSRSHSFLEGGWVAGGGIAYAFQPNWTIGLTYLHLDFDSRSQVLGAAQFRQDTRVDLVRAELNYKF